MRLKKQEKCWQIYKENKKFKLKKFRIRVESLIKLKERRALSFTVADSSRGLKTPYFCLSAFIFEKKNLR